MFSATQTYFNKAVILLLDHGADGSYGIILNKPSTYTLRSVDTNRGDVLEPFSSCRLHLGGDVGGGDMIMLHAVPGLQGSVEVVKGMWIGGIDAASQAIKEGRCSASEFKWYTNYAGWGAGQLEGECKRGVWFTAAASPALLLKDVSSPESGAQLWHDVLEQMGGDFTQLSKTVKDKESEKAEREKPADDLMP